MPLAQMHYYGPWQIPYKVSNALCSDGKRRTAITRAEPDSYFSLPARVRVKGRTVSGYITGYETEDGQRDYKFIAYTYGKNGHLLPDPQ